MPRGDRKGPMGMGPLSGRGAGYCAGYDMPGHANPGFGRGFGMGRGRGFRGGGYGGGGWGWRNRYWATGVPGWQRFGYGAPPAMSVEQDRHALEQQAAALQDELDAIRRRLEELESDAPQTKD